MKKFFKALLITTFACCLTVSVSGCTSQYLESPDEFDMDDSYRLSWDAVDNARSYVIAVSGEGGFYQEETVRRTSYALSALDEGDYVIKVKAVGDGKTYGDSGWSEEISFHRDYENGCLYELTNNSTAYQLSRVGAASGLVEVGDSYRGKPVTSIKSAAFRNSSALTSVVIGSNVTTIGDNAFFNCSKLTSVTFSDSVETIGTAAFQACYQLNHVELPASVTAIGDYVFNYCRSLSDVKMGDITSLGQYAFANCTSLTSLALPDSVEQIDEYAFSGDTALEEITLGSGLQSIGQYAFYKDKALKEVSFAENSQLTTIDGHAFQECSALESITLPDGVEEVGNYAFYGATSLAEISLPDSVNSMGFYAFRRTAIYNTAKENGEQLVFADTWLADVVADELNNITTITADSFPQGVVGIADYTFYNSTSLLRVALPAEVKYIGNFAFSTCESLWDFKSNESALEEVGTGAFMGCKFLRQVTFGDSLKTIGSKAFYECTILDNNTIDEGGSSALIPSSVTRIGSMAFYGTKIWDNADEYGVIYAGNWVVGYTGLEDAIALGWMAAGNKSNNESFIQLSNAVGIADYAFYYDNDLSQIAGTTTVKYVGEGAFYNCTSLATFTFSSSIRTVADYTFYGCNSLFTVNLPSRLTAVGRSAFYNCTELSTVDLLATRVVTVGDFAFYNCKNLTSAPLSDTLQSLGKYAFYNCNSLTEMEIPASVVQIGNRAFYKCEGLTSLTFENGVENIGDYAFASCVGLTEISLPDSLETVGSHAFYGCTAVEKLELGKGVSEIGDYAFAYLGNLSSVVLPASLSRVGNFAFRSCGSLTSVLTNGNIQTVGKHAFYGCDDMTIYMQAEGETEGWNTYWNSSYRPVIWGCELSDDGSYVVAVEVSETSFSNYNERSGNSAPVREGYEFLGWSTSEYSQNVEYLLGEMDSVPLGTKLYAVWKKV